MHILLSLLGALFAFLGIGLAYLDVTSGAGLTYTDVGLIALGWVLIVFSGVFSYE